MKPIRILYSAPGQVAHVAVQLRLPDRDGYRQVVSAALAIDRLPAFVDRVVAAALLAIHGKPDKAGQVSQSQWSHLRPPIDPQREGPAAGACHGLMRS